MFLHVLRKMLRNKWMVLCLVIGSLLAVSTISSMPIYSNSIFQRMLIKDLEQYQVENHTYPGQITVFHNMRSAGTSTEKLSEYQKVSDVMNEEWISELGLPILAQSQSYNTLPLASLSDLFAGHKNKEVEVQITATKDMDRHISMVSGQYPSAEMKDGYYEAMVSKYAMGYLGLSTGDTAIISPYSSESDLMDPIKIKITGVFEFKDPSDLYWSQGQSAYSKNLVIDSKLYEKLFLQGDAASLTANINWSFAVDYSQMQVSKSSFYRSILTEKQGSFTAATTVNTPLTGVLESYSSRMSSLSVTLWILQIPVILMLLLYIFMVSKLIVDYDSNDIAVQKSRGSSNLQIFNSYLAESIAISAIALLIGPFIGYAICKILGLSNGFLEFVSRKGVQVELVPEAYLYSLLAIGAFIITMLIPVLAAARGNIVKLKRSKSRNNDKPFWKKFFLDFVLMGISLYGYFSYQNNIKMLKNMGTSAADSPMDPLLFMISTLFILASALLFLRLYPLFIRFIFWVGKKHWGPGSYASLIQVSRTGSSHFLMVFLIMTVSLGIFSSVSARTINTFIEDHVKYSEGADIVLKDRWAYQAVEVYLDSAGNVVPPEDDSSSNVNPSTLFLYTEPSFSKYTQLNTIKLATKVFRDNNTTITSDSSNSSTLSKVELMGIIPYEFGQVAWSRSDLLPAPFNQYLNILTETPNAAFISRSIAESGKIKPGDTINLKWTGQVKSVEVTVYGVVDYWPTLNPQKQNAGDPDPKFIIGNLSYLNSDTLIQPYEIWMKRADGATTEKIYEEFEEKNISFSTLTNMQQDLVEKKNDPMLQGTNGTLTLSFIITMTITLIGFLIYWIFNIRNRTLQFGILRAMGLSKRNLIEMIIWEQILISGVAILAGILIGTVASNLFVPLLQVVYSAAEQVPPFKVVAYAGDYLRIFAILFVMLVIGSTVLGYIISKIKMDQALKLGED